MIVLEIHLDCCKPEYSHWPTKQLTLGPIQLIAELTFLN